MMAEKTTDIMKNALSGKEGPPPGEILQAAGSVLCLMPTKIFQEAVDAVHDQPDLLKELMQNYTANCGNRDPLRVSTVRLCPVCYPKTRVGYFVGQTT